MGKEKNHLKCILSYTAARACAFAVLGAAITAVGGLIASCAAERPDHFAGVLQPQAGTCDPPGRAKLVLNGSHVLFTPREGIIILDGAVAADGTIRATATSNGMDRTPYRQTFTGNLAGDRVSGSYMTPRCRYTVTLMATAR
jgi:hypothetical protein